MPSAVAAAQIPRDITSKYKTALRAACRERSFYGATPAGAQSAHGPAYNRRTVRYNRRTVQRTIGARSSAQSAHDPVHNRRTVRRTIGARSGVQSVHGLTHSPAHNRRTVRRTIGARFGAQSVHGLAYNRRTVQRTIKRTVRRNCAQVGMRQSGLRVASPGLRGNVRGVGRSLRTTISRELRPGTPAGNTRASPPPNRRSASPAWLSSSSAAGPL